MGQVRQWTNDLIPTRLIIRLSAGMLFPIMLFPITLFPTMLFPITLFIGITNSGEFIQQAKRIIQILQHIFRRANLGEFISLHPTPRCRVIWLVKTGSH